MENFSPLEPLDADSFLPVGPSAILVGDDSSEVTNTDEGVCNVSLSSIDFDDRSVSLLGLSEINFCRLFSGLAVSLDSANLVAVSSLPHRLKLCLPATTLVLVSILTNW